MKNNRYWMMVLIISITLLLSCCGRVEPSTPTNISVKTDVPTLAATQTPTATKNSTATVTFTPLPTLNPEEEKVAILELLKSNGGCKYPCWWGITPGQTSQETAFASLEKVGFPPIWYDKGKWYYNIRLISTPPEESIYIDYEIFLKNGLINFLHVRGSGGFLNRSAFIKIWNNISPESIISNYGTPSRVLIWSVSNPPCDRSPCSNAPYYLWLFYDNQGFLIRYSGVIGYKSTYTFCPIYSESGNLGGGQIDIFLKSPEDTSLLEDHVLPPTIFQESKKIVDLTGMSVEEFVNHFQQTSQSFCFSTPRNIWH